MRVNFCFWKQKKHKIEKKTSNIDSKMGDIITLVGKKNCRSSFLCRSLDCCTAKIQLGPRRRSMHCRRRRRRRRRRNRNRTRGIMVLMISFNWNGYIGWSCLFFYYYYFWVSLLRTISAVCHSQKRLGARLYRSGGRERWNVFHVIKK